MTLFTHAFPVTLMLDWLTPGETFTTREIEEVRREHWLLYTRLLHDGTSLLRFALPRCPEDRCVRFVHAAGSGSKECFRNPSQTIQKAERFFIQVTALPDVTPDGEQR